MNHQGETQLVNAQGGQEGQNGQIIYGQIGNNNIINMANDRDRVIRDYAVLTPQAINPEIVRPELQVDNFELKPVMFQMLQRVGQFNGLRLENLNCCMISNVIGANVQVHTTNNIIISIKDRLHMD